MMLNPYLIVIVRKDHSKLLEYSIKVLLHEPQDRRRFSRIMEGSTRSVKIILRDLIRTLIILKDNFTPSRNFDKNHQRCAQHLYTGPLRIFENVQRTKILRLNQEKVKL